VPHQPIGIFDSGIGGLTVLKAVAELLPHEDLIYLGDTARVPYGTKSAGTVRRYASQNIRFLLQKDVKMVVVACNTASAFALDFVKEEFPIPILGVIGPGVSGAVRTGGKRIGIIGTEGTIGSGAYEREIRQHRDGVFVTSAACPLFVSLVEEGWLECRVTEEIASIYLQPLLSQEIDTLILGCTHYPLLKKTLRR
jgi:glutamate racemase